MQFLQVVAKRPKSTQNPSPNPSRGPSDAVFHPGSIPGGPRARKRPPDAKTSAGPPQTPSQLQLYATAPPLSPTALASAIAATKKKVRRSFVGGPSPLSAPQGLASGPGGPSGTDPGWKTAPGVRKGKALKKKKFYDFGFSSFSASGGRSWAPGPSKTNPG